MSGGSYDYLCFKEPEELFARVDDIELMAQRLLELGFQDVAGDMQRLAEYCKSGRLRVAVLGAMLNDITHERTISLTSGEIFVSGLRDCLAVN